MRSSCQKLGGTVPNRNIVVRDDAIMRLLDGLENLGILIYSYSLIIIAYVIILYFH